MGAGRGLYPFRKMKIITRTVPILKQNSLNFSKGGGRGAERGSKFYFDILLYYFINELIKTLYISNFIVVYVIYFTHSSYCYVLMCFSLLLKNYNFSARNLSSPTGFDLDGCNLDV